MCYTANLLVSIQGEVMVFRSVLRVAVVVALSSAGLQAVKLGEGKAYKKGNKMYWAYIGASGGHDTSTNPETDCKQALKYYKEALQEKDFAAHEGLGKLL